MDMSTQIQIQKFESMTIIDMKNWETSEAIKTVARSLYLAVY